MKNLIIERIFQVWLLGLGCTLLFGLVTGIVNLLLYIG